MSTRALVEKVKSLGRQKFEGKIQSRFSPDSRMREDAWSLFRCARVPLLWSFSTNCRLYKRWSTINFFSPDASRETTSTSGKHWLAVLRFCTLIGSQLFWGLGVRGTDMGVHFMVLYKKPI